MHFALGAAALASGSAAAAGGVAATAAAAGAGAWAAGATALSATVGTSAAAFAGGAAATSIAAQVGGGLAASAFSATSLLSLASQGVSMYGKIQEGKAQAANMKTKAKAEQFNSRNREIDRKRNLIRSLAMQNVRGGASGVGLGGSTQNMMLESINLKEGDTISDNGSTSQRVNQLKQNASNASTFSLLSAAGDGISYAKRQMDRGTA